MVRATQSNLGRTQGQFNGVQGDRRGGGNHFYVDFHPAGKGEGLQIRSQENTVGRRDNLAAETVGIIS